ncbi:MAG: divalent-cation tolerance protein CutA [Calditrichia bacterium]
MKTNPILVFCTVPDHDTAKQISNVLVTERLAACCNLVPGIRSVYMWQGNICEEEEIQLFIKTSAEVYDSLEKRLLELHPYDVPEILALPVMRGLSTYLKWMDEHVG